MEACYYKGWDLLHDMEGKDLWLTHAFFHLLAERIKSGNEEAFILLAMNISGSIKKCLQAQAFYLGESISGNGVKMSLCLAGPTLHLPLHPHPETAQASEKKSIGWNSPQGIFGSSLGNRGVFVNQILQRKGNCSWVGCQAAVVTHESEAKPRALGESQGSAWEGNTPSATDGRPSRPGACLCIYHRGLVSPLG